MADKVSSPYWLCLSDVVGDAQNRLNSDGCALRVFEGWNSH
jgi:hypothetical protein